MKKVRNNLTGNIYRMWKVIRQANDKEQTKSNNACWLCECQKCGHKEIIDSGHLKREYSCAKCSRRWKTAEKLGQMLEDMGLTINREYTFSNLTYKGKLRYDYAILNDDNTIKYLVEYDGEPHFFPVNYGGKNHKDEVEQKFRDGQIRDIIKNQYAVKNNIPLIRIPYTQKNNLTFNLLQLEDNPFRITKYNMDTFAEYFDKIKTV